MVECVKCLIHNGYTVIAWDDDLHIRFRKYIDGNEFNLLLIGPHEGNNFRYVLRGDFVELHDRWVNADYQCSFANLKQFLKDWNHFWISYEDETSDL